MIQLFQKFASSHRDTAQGIRSTVDGKLRLDLRGERPLGLAPRLRFVYRLKGDPESLKVSLFSRARKEQEVVDFPRPCKIPWSTLGVIFDERLDRADELVFQVAAGAEVQVDDVVLYERGEPK